MCIACDQKIDPAVQGEFAERMLSMLNSGMIMLMVSIGHRAGLFDALADGRSRTCWELASATGMNERYLREWLAGMTASRVLERDAVGDTFRLPAEHALALCRQSPSGNMALYAQYITSLAPVEDRLLECFRAGGGVPYSEYPRFHDIMEEDSNQAVVSVLLERVLPLLPGLEERLRAGIDVLDVGCGRGRALVRLAAAFPASRFVGYDLSGEAVAAGNALASELGLGNLRFGQVDLTEWSEPGSFDWITAFDAIHDQGRPDRVLAAIRQALRPGGVFLMQDIDGSSEPNDNREHPLGPLLYGVSLFHCMTVSLAQSGMGLGTMWGVQLAERMLREAGFDDIAIHRFEDDVQNAYFVMKA